MGYGNDAPAPVTSAAWAAKTAALSAAPIEICLKTRLNIWVPSVLVEEIRQAFKAPVSANVCILEAQNDRIVTVTYPT